MIPVHVVETRCEKNNMPVYAFGNRIPKIDPSAWVFPSADIIGKVTIGSKVYIGAGAVVRGDYGTIVIGDGSAIEENATLHARVSNRLEIGKDVTVGHAAMLHNCTIKDNAVIGMNSTVTDDATVGEWSIVAEGAVVKRGSVVPPGTIFGGVPAVQVGLVSDKQREFWTAAKQIYQGLTVEYKQKLRLIGW